MLCMYIHTYCHGRQRLFFRYNDPGEMNDGPLCRCSARTKRQGIRHGVYAAESSPMLCDIYTNNADKLYHYRFVYFRKCNAYVLYM